ncbi:MAG TPA: MbtH family protein [Pyrinomonadaceae bacterium]
MSKDGREEKAAYKVVVSREERYSIWPAHRENARGFRDAGKSGTEQECLAYIEKMTKDERPPAEKKKK